jgi:hypothetical protein
VKIGRLAHARQLLPFVPREFDGVFHFAPHLKRHVSGLKCGCTPRSRTWKAFSQVLARRHTTRRALLRRCLERRRLVMFALTPEALQQLGFGRQHFLVERLHVLSLIRRRWS